MSLLSALTSKLGAILAPADPNSRHAHPPDTAPAEGTTVAAESICCPRCGNDRGSFAGVPGASIAGKCGRCGARAEYRIANSADEAQADGSDYVVIVMAKRRRGDEPLPGWWEGD